MWKHLIATFVLKHLFQFVLQPFNEFSSSAVEIRNREKKFENLNENKVQAPPPPSLLGFSSAFKAPPLHRLVTMAT